MKVQTKIILVLCFVVAIFMVGFLIFNQREKQKADLIFQQDESQKNAFFDKLVELKGGSLETLAFDYTYWDEMLNFVETGDPVWASDMLDTSLPNYKVDAMWIFRTDGSPVYAISKSGEGYVRDKAIPLGKAVIHELLAKSRFCHFFLNTAQGLMEIRGATIHPTHDVERKTPVRGYFFVGRLWNREYIEELAKLTESTISLAPVHDEETQDGDFDLEAGTITFSKSLNGWDGRAISRIKVETESRIIKEFNRALNRDLLQYSIFALITLIFLSVSLLRWVSNPLNLISDSLDAEDPAIIKSLQKDKTEFGRLASLINRFFVQRKELIQEISERKQAEESLAAEKEKLAVTLRSIGDGVITTDIHGKVALINKVAEEITGWTQEEAIGKSLPEIFHIINEKTRERLENPVDKVLISGAIGGLSNQTVLITRDGKERIIADSSAPIRDRESNVIGVVIVFRDITERRRIEEELLKTQKLESVGVLAGGIAHDFNNLLTGILGNISLTKMYANEGDKIYKRLTEAERACFRAKDLTGLLLTFSKGGAPVKKVVSALGNLVRDTASFAVSGSNVRCEFDMDEGIWVVELDEGQISQVINNLVINAQQAMPEGGVIRVKVKNIMAGKEELIQLGESRYVRVTVEDNGIGIREEHLSKIFDPYFTTKQKGSGLGLSVAYSVIKNHDGYIGVESEPGIGAKFHIYLPATEKAAEEGGEEMKIRSGNGRVLVMDDEEVVRGVAGEILGHLGYEVEFARDGDEAVELYNRTRENGRVFDLVIMDLTVPGGMGGKEAIKKLLVLDPEVRVIVSSGYSNDPVMSEYRKYGFRGVITKPYKPEELSETVYKVINWGKDMHEATI